MYEDSDPQRVAKKFIRQQRIDSSTYYEELVLMMVQAKEKALQDKQRQ